MVHHVTSRLYKVHFPIFTRTACNDSVGIVTRLKAGLFDIQHPARAIYTYFTFVQNAQIKTGAQATSCLIVTKVSVVGGKTAEA
jgi:hypothetical protein